MPVLGPDEVKPAELFGISDAAAMVDDQYVLDVGERLFYFVSEWSSWVERRVERVSCINVNTVRRAVSVDLVVPTVIPPLGPFKESPSETYLLPIALHAKRRLSAFSISDTRGGSLPLLAKRHNVPAVAATLVAAARAWGGVSVDRPIPVPVAFDFWSIASDPPEKAIGVWRALGRQLNEDDANERAWRQALVNAPEFMALAFDFARSFLLAILLDAKPGDRRLIKLSYEESSTPALSRPGSVRPRTVGPAAEPTKQTGDTDQRAPKGQLTIKAVVKPDQPDMPDVPACDITYIVVGPAGRHLVTTRKNGEAQVQASVGDYFVAEEILPAEFLPTSPAMKITLVRGPNPPITFEYRPSPQKDPDDLLPALGWMQRATQVVALSSKTIAVLAPSIGQAASYHLEFEAPEGTQVTRAELSDSLSYGGEGSRQARDTDVQSSQRANVYASNVAQEHTGVSIFNVRPRPATIVRPATLTAVLSLALILMIVVISALSWWQTGDDADRNPTTLMTLMLVVPGGLSAYISAGASDPFTGRLLFGLRLLALSNGFWAFATAGVLAVADLTTKDGFATAVEPWGIGFFALLAIAAGQAASLTILSIVLRRTRRPPEQRVKRKPAPVQAALSGAD